MEARRKLLMARQPQWGDSSALLYHNVPISPSPPPHLAPAQWDSSSSSSQNGTPLRQQSPALSISNRELDALIMAKPKERRKPPVINVPTMSSCRDWSLDALVRQSKNFVAVPRVRWSATKPTEIQIQEHEDANRGVPLVVEGLHKHPHWLKDKFTPEWLERHHGRDVISARNVCDRVDRDLTLSEFIAHARTISPFAQPEEKERLYGKDVPCPRQWADFLHRGIIPHYLAPKSPENVLNNLPQDVRPETLMCYLGVGDTFTPCHKDLCASSGHNLMCYTEDGGSSFWFMTATSSANAAAEYFHTRIKQELDHEAHVITLAELAKAPFKVYIVEQKLGDLVLVPPRSAHQVVNAGGITIKTSWSRMTLDGLSLALRYELPLYRSEVYRVKANIYYTLLTTIQQVSDSQHLSNSRNAVATTSQNDMPTLLNNLRRILLLFDSILIEEYSPEAETPYMRKLAEDDEYIDHHVCDFCGGDIFQSFFECRSCVDPPRPAKHGAGLIICPGCYVEGRTCHCEVMAPVQCRPIDKLFDTRKRAVDLYNGLGLDRRMVDTVPSKEELIADARPGLFRAALYLRKRRRANGTKTSNFDETRRCKVNREGGALNHSSPNAWQLQCKKCHSGICFAHLTFESCLHAAEALLTYAKDEPNNAVFHEAHQASKKRFEAEIATLKREEPDYIPDLRIQLAYLASTFSCCRPIHPREELRKEGFYDLSVWEMEVPEGMGASQRRAVVASSQPAPPKRKPAPPKRKPAPPKRTFMDCVLLPAPAKRKEREIRPASTSGPRVGVSPDKEDDELRITKRRKLAHPPKRPPGLRALSPTRPVAGPSRGKNAIIIDSDSEDDQPLAKKSRLNSRLNSRLYKSTRFEGPKDGPQPAASVADAVNNAYLQNSKTIIPSTVRPAPPSSAAPPLPRRNTKRKATPPSPPMAVSSSPDPNSPGVESDVAMVDAFSSRQETRARQPAELRDLSQTLAGGSKRRGISTQVGPSSSTRPSRKSSTSRTTLEETLAQIQDTLSTVEANQERQGAEVRDMRQMYSHLRGAERIDSVERQYSNTQGTVQIVADLVRGLVSTLQQPAAPAFNAGPSYPRQGPFANQSRYVYTSYRGRGRGRGGGAGHHMHRSASAGNTFQVE
ncbi:hypothetical protein C8F04DRAFT_214948 [Mycena alexandri]|uniref:JmjC domain-containing protein n=1 Tax=Mycena alexandri TaxID=1745969 RepID=A0AAD6THY6_9AGAR|nr:hypothetical protein C8F04DRAFT_214948 [Mycena alexandri]